MPEQVTAVQFETPVTLTHSEALAPNVPFAPESLGRIMISGMVEKNTEPQPEPQSEPLQRINRAHGRSFEVAKLAFADEHGNRYSTLSLKGAGPYSLKKHSAFSADEIGYTPEGFASNAAVQRITKVSTVFRRLGVDTEYPVAVGRPDTFPIPTENGVRHMTQAEIYDHIEPGTVVPEGHELSVYVRASRTPIRLNDFSESSKTPRSPEYMSQLLEGLARDLRATAKTAQERDAVFDPKNPEQVKEYFMTTLPRILGTNIAKVHAEGLVHNSLTDGNVTASGGIVDLDSVTGTPLGFGDKQVLPIDMLGDLYLLIGGLSSEHTQLDEHQQIIKNDHLRDAQEIMLSLSIAGLLGNSEDALSKRIDSGKAYAETFRSNLLQAYTEAGEQSQFCKTVMKLYEQGNSAYAQGLLQQVSQTIYG